MDSVKERSTCRACGGSWAEVWDLGGPMHLNDFPKDEIRRPAVPLVLCRCHPCGLLQLKHTTPPEWMFRDHYWYRSGLNEAMRRHLHGVVDHARSLVPVGPDDTVIDIGANDGTLLSFYPTKRGPFRVGIEPAQNMAAELGENCDAYVPGFFPTGESFHWQAKIITSCAMFYDLEEPGEFVAEVKRLLHPEGIWVNQLAYLPAMLRNAAWDSVCHEHLAYYCLSTLLPLLQQHGLQAIDVEEVPVNEGSIRVTITHRDSRVPVTADAFERIRNMVAVEQLAGLTCTNEPYFALRNRAQAMRDEVRKFLLMTTIARKKVDLLGASTKGNTYLQFCGIDSRMVRRVIDRSLEKVGRHTVTAIPIVSEEEGRQDPAPYVLCLIWAFRDAILERERGKWPAGTKFVFPMPRLEVVDL